MYETITSTHTSIRAHTHLHTHTHWHNDPLIYNKMCQCAQHHPQHPSKPGRFGHGRIEHVNVCVLCGETQPIENEIA